MSRIVVFANGILNQSAALRNWLRPDDRIFCADGGTLNALALDLTPEVVVGDLDSLPADTVARLEAAGAIIDRYPAKKDQTDLELALEKAIAEKPDEILLATALGGRLDQLLANVLLLTGDAYAPVKMTLVDGRQWARLVRAGQRLTVQGRPGDTVSLVPLTPTVTEVTFQGVAWPLDRATLSLGSTWSISNQMTEATAVVTVGQGLLLAVHIDQNYEEEN